MPKLSPDSVSTIRKRLEDEHAKLIRESDDSPKLTTRKLARERAAWLHDLIDRVFAPG